MDQLDFMYMIFQSNAHQDRVSFFLDGEKIKRSMKRDNFLELVKSKDPDLLKAAYECCNDYSFHFWSVPDHTINHLFPQADEETQYPDNLNALIHNKPRKTMVKESQTVQDVLMGYGFSAPTQYTVANLQTLLQKREPEEEGLLSRFFNRRRTPIKQPPREPTKMR